MKKILLTSLTALALLVPLTPKAEAHGWYHHGYYGYHRSYYGYHHRYWHQGYWRAGFWYPGFYNYYPVGPYFID